MRLKDISYRIVKMGRHAVSVAVCAMTGMMFAGGALATDYFAGINANTSTSTNSSGTYSLTVTTSNNGGATAANRIAGTQTNDDAVFTPTSWATSSYTGSTFNSNGAGPTSNYTVQTTSASLPTLTLTFDAGANALNIYKAALTNYTTTTTGTNNIGGNTTYSLNGAASTGYTANLIFNGTNTVAGNTDIDSGSITISGGPVAFAGTVESGAIAVNGGNVSFNGNVNTSGQSITYGAANQVTFQGGADLTGGVNFAGYNGTLNLGTGSDITGSVATSGYQSGTINFAGSSHITGSVGDSGTLALLQANGVNGTLVQIDGLAKAEVLNLNSGIVALGGGIDTRRQDLTLGSVNFGNYDGVVQIGDDSDLTGNVTTTANNKGTLTMVSGTQIVTGNIGSSTHAIKTLNIGGENTGGIDNSVDNYSTTTINGHVFAQNTVLNNDANVSSSTLNMASGYNLTSTVTTTDANMGILSLEGGTQTVSGSVGVTGTRLAQVNSGAAGATSNFSSDVFAVTVSNTDNGTTNFANDVGATTINVGAGISNFTNTVTATTINIGSGVANLNTNGTGTTTANIAFSASSSATTSATGNYTTAELGSATANLINGLTGTVAFAGNDAVVNVWDGKGISGAITTLTHSNTGVVNYRGDGTIGSTVGASALGIKELNINTNSNQNTAAGVTASGSIFAGIVNLQNNGTLTIADNANITGTTTNETNVTLLTGTQQVIAAALNSGNTTGTLKFVGNSAVTGVVGANGTAINTIEAGATGKTVTFNNMVYATNLNYTGNGTVVLNGTAGVDVNTAGLKGTVDFGTNGTSTGELQIGDGVNLTVGSTGIQFADANGATLTFNGSSTVMGTLGSASGTDTFAEIYAGIATETVTFKNDVYVKEGSLNPATFYVSGTGIVNFEGNLNGDLVYNADGTVNVSHDKSISVTTVPVAVTTIADNTGTLNFLGKTTLDTDIGTNALKLKAVTFNSASNNITQTINKNIYATDVVIGGGAGTTAIAKQDVTGQFDYAGATQMSAFTGGTTANVTTNVTLGGNLTLANATTALNVGTSHITVGGAVNTNGAAMSFTVNTQDVTGVDDAASTSSGSGQIVATGNLTMTGAEKVHVNYVGSLASSGTYNLIESAGGTTVNATANTTVAGSYNRTEGAFVSDNSFSIDSRVYTNATGELIVAADRTGGSTYAVDQLYAQKSATVGHFSNNAASVIAGIAAAGSQTGDMIQVIQKLEIDSFGYGNNADNLATQVKKLAPVVNASLTQSAMAASQMVANATGTRLTALRGDTLASSSDYSGIAAGEAANKDGFWLKGFGSEGKQKQVDAYDGFTTSTTGFAVGYDSRVNKDTILGLALGYTDANVKQADFRSGDSTKIKGYQLMAYASHDVDQNLYVEGALTLGSNDYDGSRATAVGRVAKADFNGTQAGGRLGLGYRMAMDNKLTFTPMASIDFSQLKQESYTETGAGALNLNVEGQTLTRTRATVGGRLTKEIESNGTIYRPEFYLGFYSDSGNLNKDVTATYQGGGASFTTAGADVDKTGYNVGLGLSVLADKRTTVQVRYDYDARKSFTGHTGSLLGRWAF